MNWTPIRKKARNTNTLRNLDNLLWLKFLEIIKTDNVFLLDENYHPKKRYSLKDKEVFSDAWIKLKDEAYQAEDNEETKSFLNKEMDRALLVTKIKSLKATYDMLVFTDNNQDILLDYDSKIQELYAIIRRQDPRLKIKYFEEVQTNLILIESALGSLQNEYNTVHKVVLDKVQKKEDTAGAAVIRVNKVTGLGLVLSTMNCSEWFEAKRIYKIELAQLEKNRKPNVSQ